MSGKVHQHSQLVDSRESGSFSLIQNTNSYFLLKLVITLLGEFIKRSLSFSMQLSKTKFLKNNFLSKIWANVIKLILLQEDF